MKRVNVKIRGLEPKKDFTVIYKGRDGFEEIKVTKTKLINTLNYFNQRKNEIEHIDEYFIHDKYSTKIFKDFISSIENQEIILDENNYNDYYELCNKYEYVSLLKEIEIFIQDRPDLFLLAKEIAQEKENDADKKLSSLKVEILARNLDTCLQNGLLKNLPLSSINRILNYPNRCLKNHQLLFVFVMKLINENEEKLKNEKNAEKRCELEEHLSFLTNSLDFMEMSEDEIEQFLSLSEKISLFNHQNSNERMKIILKEKTEMKKERDDFEVKVQLIFDQMKIQEQRIKVLEEKFADFNSNTSEKFEKISDQSKKIKNEIERNNSNSMSEIKKISNQISKQSKAINNEIERNNLNAKKLEERFLSIEKAQINSNENEKLIIEENKVLKNQIIQNHQSIEKVLMAKIEEDKRYQEIEKEIKEIKKKMESFVVKYNKIPDLIKHQSNKAENINRELIKKPNKKILNFPSKNEEFDGIINYLKINFKDSINNEMKIFSSSVYNKKMKPENAILYNDNKSYFSSQNEPNSWICFDFNQRRIVPISYILRSIPFGEGNYHPKSWVIEVSNDNNDWTIIDQQQNCSFLNGQNQIHCFEIKNQINEEFRYIRMRLTDETYQKSFYYLEINSFEVYGKLIM